MKINIHLYQSNITNESRMFKEAKFISKNLEFDKILLLGIWKKGLLENEKLQDNIFIKRVRLFNIKNKNIMFFYYCFFALFYVLFKKPAMLNIHSAELLPTAIIKKIYKNVVIYDTHELESEKNQLGKTRKKILKFIEKFFIGYCDETIVVSKNIQQWYEKSYNITPHLVLNTPNLINIKKQNIFRHTLNIKENQTIFLYQGGLGKSRGIEIILKTFKNIKDKNNVIVFMGYGELESLIKQEVSSNTNIYFHKAVSPESLLEYTCSADYGISLIEDTCLSYRYCLPNKIFEYIMANLPVISSNLTEMKTLVKTNQIGTVSKENTPICLNEAIEEIKAKDYETLLKNLEKTKQIYNWENQERVLESLYKELLG